MFMSSMKMVHAVKNALNINGVCSACTMATYEEAVEALNKLQSNAAYLRNRANDVKYSKRKNLEDTRKYLKRSGISLEQLDELSVIHVAGTKGKGSVCAFAESLLRNHGVGTGLYTSPHLVSVRERLRINGSPIDEKKFTNYFWKLYRALEKEREYDGDMPQYFKFLTILMFHVFLDSPIDVAIIEVGIGGEEDCTNVVRNPVCVGITSLGLDHTSLLGNTLEAIAYQKSGIFKNGTSAFTVPQPSEAMRILDKRSKDKQCSLSIVPAIDNYPWRGNPPVLGIRGDFQSYNASMAISMSRLWLERNPTRYKEFSFDIAASALSSCEWPGRMQILRSSSIDFYLDGAHTLESMKFCASWFGECTKNCKEKRALIFNTTGDRNSAELLGVLRSLEFHRVFFVPNVAGKVATTDQMNYNVSSEEQIRRCENHCDIWGKGSVSGRSVLEALDRIRKEDENDAHLANKYSRGKTKLLITGSLHLVGAALAVLDPDLTMNTKF